MSTAGGISKAVTNAARLGCNGFAMFLKSPRRWQGPPMTQKEIDQFSKNCKELGYNPHTDILPHGQYMINLASPKEDMEAKSYESFLDEILRCEQLDVRHYNFHPGSKLDGDHREALERLAKNINKVHKETKLCKVVIENMAGHGNLIGGSLEDIRDVIEMVEDKSRVGVCVDTCHAFAAGYDMLTEESFNKFWNDFEEIIGWEYLSGIHLNDSKAPLSSNRDLHQNLGQGFLGLEAFRNVANFEKLQGIPIILETPVGEKDDDTVYGQEIKILEFLEGRDSDDADYIATAEKYLKMGAAERKEHQKKFDEKQAKEAKAKAKAEARAIKADDDSKKRKSKGIDVLVTKRTRSAKR